MKKINRFTAALLPTVLGITSAASGQQPPASIPPAVPATQADAPKAGDSGKRGAKRWVDHIHPTDEQLLLAVSDRGATMQVPAMYHVVKADGPRPGNDTDAHFYDLVRRANKDLKAPVTDIILYQGGPLGNAFSFVLGDRKCIMICTREYDGKPPDLQDRMQSGVVGHELGHLLRKHTRNTLQNLNEEVISLRLCRGRLKWLNNGLKSDDPLQDTLITYWNYFASMLAEQEKTAEIFAGQLPPVPAALQAKATKLLAEYEKKPAPSEAAARKEVRAMVRKMSAQARTSRQHEMKVDEMAMRVTRDPEAAEMALAEMAATQINRARMRNFAQALTQGVFVGWPTLVTPQEAIAMTDKKLVELNKIGMDDHPLTVTRYAQDKYWRDHHPKPAEAKSR